MADEKKLPVVSRGEEAAYGPLALTMRLLQNVLANAEDAQMAVYACLDESAMSDSLHPEHGRSEHTEWLNSVWDRINEHHRASRRLYQTLTFEAQERWMKVDSEPPPIGEVDTMLRRLGNAERIADELEEAVRHGNRLTTAKLSQIVADLRD